MRPVFQGGALCWQGVIGGGLTVAPAFPAQRMGDGYSSLITDLPPVVSGNLDLHDAGFGAYPLAIGDQHVG